MRIEDATMLTEKDMADFHATIYFDNESNSTSLNDIKIRLEQTAENVGIPLAFSHGKITTYKVFCKTIHDCIILYHPDHKRDYYNFCVYLSRQDNRIFIHIKMFGRSKQFNKHARSEQAKADRLGKELAYQLGSMLGSCLYNIGKSTRKLEEEQEYYSALDQVFENTF